MKTIHLGADHINLAGAVILAENEPVLNLSAGKEYMLSAVDDFDEEIEALRNRVRFQEFLDERRKSVGRISIDELERRLSAPTE